MALILVLVAVGMMIEVFLTLDVVVRGRSRRPVEVRIDRL